MSTSDFFDSVAAWRAAWALHPEAAPFHHRRALNLLKSRARLVVPKEPHPFDFHIRKEHCITYKEKGAELPPKESRVLLVVRNAVAHLPDFAFEDQGDVNVAFGPEGVLRCWSENKSSEVIFREESGFLEFLRDLTGLCRRAAGKQVTVS